MRTRALHWQEPAMDFRFCLVFPRESLSIPVMRRVLGDTLTRLGVEEDCICDLLLAVTEACTNVLRHAGPGRRYEVVVRVNRQRCVLQVLDNGRGFDPARIPAHRSHRRRPAVKPVPLLKRRIKSAAVSAGTGGSGSTEPSQLAESGRGLAIMRACVDDVSLRSGPGRGTVVLLSKRIDWRDDAPLVNIGGWALRDAG